MVSCRTGWKASQCLCTKTRITLCIVVFGNVASGYCVIMEFCQRHTNALPQTHILNVPANPTFLKCNPAHRSYRLLVVINSDCLWVGIPICYGQYDRNIPITIGQFYRWFMGRNTDMLWSVLPMVYGQSQVRISCK